MSFSLLTTRILTGVALIASTVSIATQITGPATPQKYFALPPLVSLGILLCGICLWLSTSEKPRLGVIRFLAGSILLGGLFALFAITFGWLDGIESRVLHSLTPPETDSTGIVVAAIFICFGSVLLFFDQVSPRLRVLTHLPLLPVYWITYLALLATFYGVEARTAFFAYTLLSFPESVLFILLATAALFARPRSGLMAAITSPFSGGMLARILLPIIILLPLTVGWIRIRALRTGDYELSAAFAQFATTNVMSFGLLIWLCALILNRFDAARQQTLDSLRDTNSELQRVNDALESKMMEQERTEAARKKTELQLFQSQKMQAVGTLASGIAHDFNNMLAVVLMNTASAEDVLPKNHPVRQNLAEIRKSGTRGTQLIRQLLAFGRKDSSTLSSLKLDAVISEAVELLRQTLPSNVRIHSEYQEGLPPLLADATQIHQVVFNLGTNAAHSMAHSGGTLKIRAYLIGAAQKQSGASDSESTFIRVTFTDTGHGIDKDTLKQIFDPFFTTKDPGKGTGLGLSVVHGIMKLHGGDITVSSATEKGTIFTLDFPVLATEAPGAMSPSPKKGIPPGNGTHLLCVDDNELILSSLRRKLTLQDYQVTCLSEPQMALKVFRAKPKDFDIVLTDFSMPGMSGPDFAREVLLVRKDIPVVMMSGFLGPEDIDAAKATGVRDFVRKPNVLDDLGEFLSRFLDSKERERL